MAGRYIETFQRRATDGRTTLRRSVLRKREKMDRPERYSRAPPSARALVCVRFVYIHVRVCYPETRTRSSLLALWKVRPPLTSSSGRTSFLPSSATPRAARGMDLRRELDSVVMRGARGNCTEERRSLTRH